MKIIVHVRLSLTDLLTESNYLLIFLINLFLGPLQVGFQLFDILYSASSFYIILTLTSRWVGVLRIIGIIM